MAQAWQVRSYQRQRLLERLMRMVYQQEEASGEKTFLFDLILVVAGYLKERREAPSGSEFKAQTDTARFFLQKLLSEITEFSRSLTERDALIAKFLEKLLESGLSPFFMALTRQEIEEPQDVFHAPSASAEVSFEDE